MTSKENIVEEMGVYFEQNQNMSPIAARIMSLLIISPPEGYSFDEIVCFFKSSKSSISTNLKFLLELDSIEYFTKPGDRKRYFRSKQNYLHNTLRRSYKQVSDELVIVRKISQYNKNFNPIRYEKHKCYVEIYKDVLEKSALNLSNALDEMEKVRKTNK